MIKYVLFALFVIGLLHAVVSPSQAQPTTDESTAGFSAEVRELIEIGDAAMLRAEESRELSSSIQATLNELTKDSGENSGRPKIRALTPNEDASDMPSPSILSNDDAALQTLEALRIEADETAKRSVDEAVESWKRAMAIDPEAQETILRRLLGAQPRS